MSQRFLRSACSIPPSKLQMTPSRTPEESLSLDDYSTFQYMLAGPSIAKVVAKQITAVVFYNEPRDERKAEAEHRVLVRIQGHLTCLHYYGCCLTVWPSHALGMSRWIMAEDCRTSTPRSGETLRIFRYAYYGGLLTVETRHVSVCVNDGGAFRLVEYFDCVVSPWVFLHAMVAVATLILDKFLQMFGDRVPILVSIAATMAVLHLVLRLTGTRMW